MKGIADCVDVRPEIAACEETLFAIQSTKARTAGLLVPPPGLPPCPPSIWAILLLVEDSDVVVASSSPSRLCAPKNCAHPLRPSTQARLKPFAPRVSQWSQPSTTPSHSPYWALRTVTRPSLPHMCVGSARPDFSRRFRSASSLSSKIILGSHRGWNILKQAQSTSVGDSASEGSTSFFLASHPQRNNEFRAAEASMD